MLLTKKSDRVAAAGPRLRRLVGARLPTMDRRTFLKRSGLVAGAGRLRRNVAECPPWVGVDRVIGEVGAR